MQRFTAFVLAYGSNVASYARPDVVAEHRSDLHDPNSGICRLHGILKRGLDFEV